MENTRIRVQKHKAGVENARASSLRPVKNYIKLLTKPGNNFF